MSLPFPPRSAAPQRPVPPGLLISVAVLLGCWHGQAPAPNLAPNPPPVVVRIAILQEGVGALEVDPAAGTARLVSANVHLFVGDAEQHGPLVTFTRSEQGVLDLRDLAGGPVINPELKDALEYPSVISSGSGVDGVVIAGLLDGAIHVRGIAARSLPGPDRTLPAPAPEIESVAVSPDGTTLAVVAGAKAEGYPPSDLFTIRLLDGATERWTNDGSVVDAAFVDDHTVIFVGEANGFDVLDLNTRSTRRIATPEGWTPDRLDLYVGRDTSIRSAPLLPMRDAKDGRSRALLDPVSGKRVELSHDDWIVAVAAGGSAVVLTTECSVPGGLIRRAPGGTTRELRASPARAACAPVYDADDRFPPPPVSAVFSAGGRYLVYAVPIAAGWRVLVEDAAGHTRTVLESSSAVRVVGWP